MFDGETYDHKRDCARLSSQLLRVRDLMLDGVERTLAEISAATGDESAASVSARLRDLRKPRFGRYTVLRTYLNNGLYSYRVLAPTGESQ